MSRRKRFFGSIYSILHCIHNITTYTVLLRKDRHRRLAQLSTLEVFSSELAAHPAGLKERTFGKEEAERLKPGPEASTQRPLVAPQRRCRTSQPLINVSAVEHAHRRTRLCRAFQPIREPQSCQSSRRYRRRRGVASGNTARACAEGAGLPCQDGGRSRRPAPGCCCCSQYFGEAHFQSGPERGQAESARALPRLVSGGAEHW